MQAQIPLQFEAITTSCGATGTAHIAATNEMFVRFGAGTGAVWCYPDVSYSQYMTLITAPSFGREWNRWKRERGAGWGERVQ